MFCRKQINLEFYRNTGAIEEEEEEKLYYDGI